MDPAPKLVSIALLAAVVQAQTATDGFVDVSLPDAKAQARAESRHLLIDFSTPLCEPCRRLRDTTWQDPRVIDWIGEHAIAIRVDPETDRDAAREFGIDAYPTILLLDADGGERGRIIGYFDGGRMLDRLREVIDSQSTDWRTREALAEALIGRGEKQAALAHYEWLWDHGEKHNPSKSGVRVSFFLRKFVELAETYPPARASLESRRDAAEQRVLGGDTRLGPVSDMVALNKKLETPERSLAVLDEVPATRWRGQDVARGVLFDAVMPLLVESRRYADVLELGGDPERIFERSTRLLAIPGLPAEVVEQQKQEIVRRAVGIVEACYGAGEKELGEEFVNRTLEVRWDADTWVRLIEAVRRAGDDVASHDLAERALEELPEDEQGPVRRALERKR